MSALVLSMKDEVRVLVEKGGACSILAVDRNLHVVILIGSILNLYVSLWRNNI